MKKLIIFLLAAVAAVGIVFPAFAEMHYPCYVIWGANADLYPDAKLAEKADRYENAIKKGTVVIMQGRSASGNINIRTMGIDGWVKPAPFTETTLAICTGDDVNVREMPKTGKAYRNLRLYKGQSVLIIDKKDLGEKYPWYKVKMYTTHECWVYGQFLQPSLPTEESVAAELRFLEEVANERGDMEVNEIKTAGIRRGSKADLAHESMALLRGAGWIGPRELKEGANKYVNTLRIMQEKIPSILHIKVKGGSVSGIAFAPRRD